MLHETPKAFFLETRFPPGRRRRHRFGPVQNQTTTTLTETRSPSHRVASVRVHRRRRRDESRRAGARRGHRRPRRPRRTERALPSFFLLSNQKQRFFFGAFGRWWNISRLITHTQRDSTENAMMMIQSIGYETQSERVRAGEKKRRMDGVCKCPSSSRLVVSSLFSQPKTPPRASMWCARF